MSAIPAVLPNGNPQSSVLHRLRARTRSIPIIGSVWLGIGLACLGLIGLAASLSWQSQIRAVAAAAANTQNVAQLLDQHAARTINSVDMVLRFVARELGPDSSNVIRRSSTTAHLAHFTRDLSLVSSVRLLDARTRRSVFEFIAREEAADITDQEAWEAHARDPSLSFYVSSPVRDEASGNWFIGVSRRVGAGEGVPGNLVVAHVALAYFQSFYDSLDLGTQGAISLYRADGLALVRRPYVPYIGRSIASSVLFREQLPRSPVGTYEAVSAADQIYRIISYRRLANAPMVIVVSLAKDEALATWREETKRNVGFALAMIIVLILFGAFLSLQIRRRDRAEEAVRSSMEFANSLIRSSADCIKVLDLDGRVTFVNDSGRCLLEIEDPCSLEGSSFVDLFPAGSRDLVSAGLSSAIRGETSQFVVFCRTIKGTPKWWDVLITPVLDPQGRPERLLVISRDITERQTQAEELRAAKEAAEHASEAKTDFLASMSHEIRTPLNGILGYTELLLDEGQLGANQQRHLERIQTAGSALLTVVNDILDFSKIEAGEIELTREPFSARALIDNAASIVSSLADKKNLPIRVVIDPMLPDILLGDEARLRQVILNLLNNAVKFTPEGHVCLDIAREGSTATGETLRVSVSDTGIGIPENKRERLFKRFSQVDGSNRREFGGTGLGLAISKRLIEQMGGEIGVESREGRGSTFWFKVTLEKGETLTGPTSQASAPRPLQPLRILLAEDMDINQEIARSVLEAVGHEVDVVADGAEAVAAVAAKTYDLVLMDIQTPGMDGITATRRIRELPSPARSVPIVAMTANVLPQQVTALKQAGMNDHVGKPFKRDELYTVVERWGGSCLRLEPDAEDSSGVLDREVYGELVTLMGRDKVLNLLDKLVSQLLVRFGGPCLEPSDRERLARDAHAMVSLAGMLGFMEFSQLCSAFEAACGLGQELEDFLDRIAAARKATLEKIEALKKAA